MRLGRFRVQNYKVVDDSDWVEVGELVTALVGKNESGKTAIERALWKSNNVSGEVFDKQLDYPRGRWATERRGNQYVTTLEFILRADEASELAALFPFPLDVPPKTVTLKTWYVGEDKTGNAIVFEESIEARCKQGGGEGRKIVEAVARELAKNVGAGDTAITDAQKAAIAKLDDSEPVWHKVNKTALEDFKAAVDEWVSTAAERAPHAQAEREKLDAVVAEAQEGDPAGEAREWSKKHLPAFIYFDDYGQLETRIHLPTYLRLSKEERIAPKVRTQRALFKWSKIDPEEIIQLGGPKQSGETDEQVQRRLDKRRTLLESASFAVTGEWMDWWIPETQHQLHMTADGEYLVLNVSDTKNPFQIPFEERSHGFQWFFSFYLVFLVESEDAHEGAILLLDEPGLHLHPGMQSKLVGFFERLSDTNQILYSTHLPFLIDGDHLERVRTVYLDDQEPPKTVVSNDAWAGDRDTLFPLQAALGYSIAQTLFLGKRTVIVEGISDYWLMKGLNDCIAALGREPRLNPDTVLIFAGGTSRMMPLASIMFATTGVEGHRMLIMLDSDAEGGTARSRFEKLLFRKESRVLMLGDAIGLEEATIEDLVPRADYAEAVGQALGKQVKLNASETAVATNVAALVKHWDRKGWGKFGVDEKVAAALWLLDEWAKDRSRIPEDTLKRATDLFAAINGRFEGKVVEDVAGAEVGSAS
jgi:hypothetical protein